MSTWFTGARRRTCLASSRRSRPTIRIFEAPRRACRSRFDVQTLGQGLNFTLTTSVGDLDLLGEVTGGGRYEDLLAHSQSIPLLGTTCQCVTLDGLIRLKRAAGRPKDLEAIAELEALRAESGQ